MTAIVQPGDTRNRIRDGSLTEIVLPGRCNFGPGPATILYSDGDSDRVMITSCRVHKARTMTPDQDQLLNLAMDGIVLLPSDLVTFVEFELAQ